MKIVYNLRINDLKDVLNLYFPVIFSITSMKINPMDEDDYFIYFKSESKLELRIYIRDNRFRLFIISETFYTKYYESSDDKKTLFGLISSIKRLLVHYKIIKDYEKIDE